MRCLTSYLNAALLGVARNFQTEVVPQNASVRPTMRGNFVAAVQNQKHGSLQSGYDFQGLDRMWAANNVFNNGYPIAIEGKYVPMSFAGKDTLLRLTSSKPGRESIAFNRMSTSYLIADQWFSTSLIQGKSPVLKKRVLPLGVRAISASTCSIFEYTFSPCLLGGLHGSIQKLFC